MPWFPILLGSDICQVGDLKFTAIKYPTLLELHANLHQWWYCSKELRIEHSEGYCWLCHSWSVLPVASLVSCCFYRAHQVLVDSRGHELQWQLQWLSMRVTEGRICRVRDMASLHRLRRQCWNDLGRAKWMKSSEHQWNGDRVKDMLFW